jgi:antitoxin ParD1/3/4
MGAMERVVLDLPVDLMSAVRNSVQSGAFASESEAIEVLLRTWYGSEGLKEPDIDTLRAFVGVGLAEVDAGKFIDAGEVHADLRAQIERAAGRHK